MTTYAGYTSLDAVQLGDGSFVSLERTGSGSSYSFSVFHRTSAGVFSGGSIGFVSGSRADWLSSLALRGNRVYLSGYDGTFPNYACFDVSGTGASQLAMSMGGNAGSASNFVFGHGSQAYFLQTDITNGGRIVGLDTASNTGYPIYYGLPKSNWGQEVIVVAPEPGSLIAMSLGTLVLLRRRKSA